MDVEPHQLCAMARTNPEGAVVLLVNTFHERLYAYLRRLTGHDADAEDLTQQTFGRVQRALNSFAGRSSVNSWLHGIAYHVYVDWRRKSRPNESRPSEWWADCVSSEATPDEIAEDADLSRHLFAEVEKLESGQREAVHLHYYQGLTLQETARVMDVATSTIKYRLRQALEQLQRQCDDERLRKCSSKDLKV